METDNGERPHHRSQGLSFVMALTLSQAVSLAPLAVEAGVELAALVAIINVESNGVVFAKVGGEELPVIRWEGHYFYRFLKGAKREKAVAMKLASPTAGAIGNPRSQDARYRTLLSRAAEIDEGAAYSSISVGVGQVMGAHWDALGFRSAKQLFEEASEGLVGQVKLMLAFIRENGLLDELQRRDWSAFARGYNGKNYAKNAYHTKMARAYGDALKLLDSRPAADVPSAVGMLRLGSKGTRVREVQQFLVRAGYAVTVDGDFGPATKAAVMDFQRQRGQEVDGVIGPRTALLLEKLRSAPSERVGEAPISQLPETVAGGGSAAGGLTVAAAAEKLSEVAEKIHGSGGTFEMIANGLYVTGGLMILGGAMWAGYGYLKSKRTYEGTA